MEEYNLHDTLGVDETGALQPSFSTKLMIGVLKTEENAIESASNEESYSQLSIESGNYIRYGDLVVIFLEEIEGYIQSVGFTNITMSPDEKQQRGRVFRILPELESAAHRLFRRALKGLPSEDGIDYSNEENLKKLKFMMLNEERSNSMCIEEHKGKPVLYESGIQLYHVETDQFLSYQKNNKMSDEDTSTNKIILTKKQSYKNGFILVSIDESQQKNNKIRYNDNFVIINMDTAEYLSTTAKQSDENLPSISPEVLNKITPSFKQQYPLCVDSIFWFTLIPDVQFTFKFYPVKDFSSDPTYLCNGSVFQLKHEALGNLLTSDGINYMDTQPEVFILRPSEDEEQSSSNTLFRIELVRENADIFEKVLYTDTFRLRHLNTGRLLTTSQRFANPYRFVGCTLAQEEVENQSAQYDDSTLFMFRAVNKEEEKYIKTSSFVQIYDFQEKCEVRLHFRGDLKVPALSGYKEDASYIQDGEIIIAGNLFDQQMNQDKRFMTELRKADTSFCNPFIIDIVEKQLVKDVMFIHECVNTLKQNIPFLCKEDSQTNIVEMNVTIRALDKFLEFDEDS